MTKKYVVVRTYSAGVHCGYLVSRKGKTVKLADCRRIWYWTGANTLNEVAANGVAQKSKISVPAIENTLTEAIEIIVCTAKGRSSLEGAKWGA